MLKLDIVALILQILVHEYTSMESVQINTRISVMSSNKICQCLMAGKIISDRKADIPDITVK